MRVWLRLGSSDELLWTRQWNFEFHIRWTFNSLSILRKACNIFICRSLLNGLKRQKKREPISACETPLLHKLHDPPAATFPTFANLSDVECHISDSCKLHPRVFITHPNILKLEFHVSCLKKFIKMYVYDEGGERCVQGFGCEARRQETTGKT
jgi:hypothetical protein